tara:strand:- start:43 stop:324 length:282 start_codon:yes stop_codon:yes gene_type:complete
MFTTITYTTAVYTLAGWRPETVTARAKPLSPKRVEVVEVLDVGENGNAGYASRTGAKRQQYSVGGVAAREVGKIKNLSACEIISSGSQMRKEG